MEEKIIKELLTIINIPFLLLINLTTYWIIYILTSYFKKSIDELNKRLILIIIICIYSYLYYIYDSYTIYILITSLIAPVNWSWILKPIMSFLNIDYKK